MLSIIHRYAAKAKEAGYPIDLWNKSGWIKLAAACGLPHETRKIAKKAVKARFGKVKGRGLASQYATSDTFLTSFEWRQVRMQALKRYGARCQCCGASAQDGLKIHVDHIKPRKTHPELALSLDNLQVLCEVCNHGKGNWDQTDWRPKLQAVK